MTELASEVLGLLTAHAGEPMDYVAVFMFLNTTDGGHYEERYGEEAIRAALAELLAAERILAVTDQHGTYFRLV
jgi:hypothetical protein